MTLQLCNDSYFFRAEEHLKELQLVRQKKKEEIEEIKNFNV